MTNETLAQTAQRLKDEGQLDVKNKTYLLFNRWHTLEDLKKQLDFSICYAQGVGLEDVMEDIAALAVLDGSIILKESE
jgi:hypothetical protein